MSKYQPLSDRLSGHPGPEWRARFSEIEALLGSALPKSAREGPAWWANNGDRAHVRAWTDAGWEVAEVDPAREAVVFRRPVSEAAMQNPRISEAEDIGPEVLPQVARTAVGKPRVSKGVQRWSLIAAGAAVTATVGALVIRGLKKRDRTPNS